MKAKSGIKEERNRVITEDGDENMADESELDDNDITGPAGMGINNVILSFAQVLNNSTMLNKLDRSGVADQQNNAGEVDHSINQDPFEWPQVEDRHYVIKSRDASAT